MDHSPEASLNLIQIFRSRVRQYGARRALLFRDPQAPRWRTIDWTAWGEAACHTALGLYSLGVRKGAVVGILSENRPEWTFADLGILSLGAASVPIYPTSSCQDILYILQNAEIEILFVSSSEQLQRIQPALKDHPDLRHVIVFEPEASENPAVLTLAGLIERGRRLGLNNDNLYDGFVDAVSASDLATLIYTSGTTGPPKGVMLTHGNFVQNYLGARERIRIGESDVALSFLPLSHVFERLAGYYFMAFSGAVIAYARNMQSVPEDILEVRPTVGAAVPRFYEKIHAKIMERVTAGPTTARLIFHWALRVGRRYRESSRPSIFSRIEFKLAECLVFKKIRASLGGKLRFFISGGAPLSAELGRFFYACGVLILEGYGLTETSPVISVNTPEQIRFGTVGQALSNVEVKIAEDGEILTRGPCVMAGYYRNPEATSACMKEGWFFTGDIGEFDRDGFLKITDRKKDLIITSGGKNISPQNIENLILADPLFSQAVILGDKRNYLVALIVPNKNELCREARTAGLPEMSWTSLLASPEVAGLMEKRLRQRTHDLAAYEQIKYFALLEREFTQEAGELTPTLKVKRKVVCEKHRDLIESLYQKGPGPKASG